MNLKELREKTVKELNKLLAQNREKFRADKFSVSAKQLKNVKAIQQTKKLVARILTVLNEKRLSANETYSVSAGALDDEEDKTVNNQ